MVCVGGSGDERPQARLLVARPLSTLREATHMIPYRDANGFFRNGRGRIRCERDECRHWASMHWPTLYLCECHSHTCPIHDKPCLGARWDTREQR